MSELLLREPPITTSNEAIPSTTQMPMSCVTNARDTATRHYDAKKIIESIRADEHFKLREPIHRIRNTFAQVMASSGNDRRAAKQAVDDAKSACQG